MAVTLSIKNVPDEIADALRSRATRNQRSLQDELLALLHEATLQNIGLSPKDALAKVRSTGVKTAATSATIVRRDRDAR